jgi:hypothetical protein
MINLPEICPYIKYKNNSTIKTARLSWKIDERNNRDSNGKRKEKKDETC